MILSFHPCFTADRQVIFYSRRKIAKDDISLIKRADLIILPQSFSGELYELCLKSGADIFPDYHARFGYQGKTGQSLLISEAGVSQPETYIWQSTEEFLRSFDDSLHGGYPFLLKTDKGHEGDGIFIIRDKEDIPGALRGLKVRGNKFVSQEFIDTGGNILRVVVMADTYISYWKRAEETDYAGIISMKNGAFVDREWNPGYQEKGRAAAKIMCEKTGINLAAFDFVFDFKRDASEALLLEINYYFGRRGLGGSINYYKTLYNALVKWMDERGYDSGRVLLV